MARLRDARAKRSGGPVVNGRAGCQQRDLFGRIPGPARRSSKGQWTLEEDELLCELVDQFKGKCWKKIAEHFKDRTDVQCLHRWRKVLNPELIKGSWSKEEDELIVELVNKHGAKKWSAIAQALPGRIGKQCRERWHNHLNPVIKKDAWSEQEEMALICAHQAYGNKWAMLTKFLPGRTDNAIKNHWNSSAKKKIAYYIQSGLLQQFQGLSYLGSINLSSSNLQATYNSSGNHGEGTSDFFKELSPPQNSQPDSETNDTVEICRILQTSSSFWDQNGVEETSQLLSCSGVSTLLPAEDVLPGFGGEEYVHEVEVDSIKDDFSANSETHLKAPLPSHSLVVPTLISPDNIFKRPVDMGLPSQLCGDFIYVDGSDETGDNAENHKLDEEKRNSKLVPVNIFSSSDVTSTEYNLQKVGDSMVNEVNENSKSNEEDSPNVEVLYHRKTICVTDENIASFKEEKLHGSPLLKPPQMSSLVVSLMNLDATSFLGDKLQVESPFGIRQLVSSCRNMSPLQSLLDSPMQTDSPCLVKKYEATRLESTATQYAKQIKWCESLKPFEVSDADKANGKEIMESWSISSLANSFSSLDILLDESGTKTAFPSEEQIIFPCQEKEHKSSHRVCTISDKMISEPMRENSKYPDESISESICGNQRGSFIDAKCMDACSKEKQSPLISKAGDSKSPGFISENLETYSTDRIGTGFFSPTQKECENGRFGEVLGRKGILLPCEWKPELLLNSPSPVRRVDTDIPIEDFDFFLSPGMRSYAHGILREMRKSKQNADPCSVNTEAFYTDDSQVIEKAVLSVCKDGNNEKENLSSSKQL